MLTDFSVHNRRGVGAAKALVSEGAFVTKKPADYTAQEAYDLLTEKLSTV